MIIAMIYLESSKNDCDTSSFKELISRIKSMSLVHQFLYESKTLSKIKAQTYIVKIITEIEKVYENRSIEIFDDIDAVTLDMDEAISLGIIVNELLNNSIKYYEGDNICIINLSLKWKEDNLQLVVKDNGKGFDHNIKSKGLGLNLIKQFAKKLNLYKYDFDTKDGTVFKLSFSLY